MLALVHPFNPTSDPGPHRTAASAATRPRQQARKPLISTTSSSIPSRSSTVAQPPPLHRHSTAPALPHKPHPQPAVSHPNSHHHERPPSPTTKIPPPVPPPPTIAAQLPPAFDIHSYPSQELLRLLASLLTQIAATNDKLESASPSLTDPPSNTPSRTSFSTLTDQDAPIWHTLTTASRTAISTPSSTLTFHARNIPTITLEAYLLRILKYCPTTNEVFLSLLVYFDRMSKLSTEATGRTFVIDSYNIHRLVIAGVTVASKFFSDVFYTNSRYAKVGGLPQAELNQLELQFLLLNDFRLVIPTEEMQRYAEQLILFSNSEAHTPTTPSTPSSSSTTAGPSSSGVPSGPSAPMQAMGAIDAYGGRIPGDQAYQPRKPLQQHYLQPGMNGFDHSRNQHDPYHTQTYTPPSFPSSNNKTPPVRPRGTYAHDGSETETEGETDAGETDGGETTDDEPTIRPTYSSAGSSSDTRSLCSASSSGAEEGDTGDEGGDEDDDEGGMDVEDSDADADEVEGAEGRGDLTPERKASSRVERGGDVTPERRYGQRIRDRDHRMASP